MGRCVTICFIILLIQRKFKPVFTLSVLVFGMRDYRFVTESLNANGQPKLSLCCWDRMNCVWTNLLFAFKCGLYWSFTLGIVGSFPVACYSLHADMKPVQHQICKCCFWKAPPANAVLHITSSVFTMPEKNAIKYHQVFKHTAFKCVCR